MLKCGDLKSLILLKGLALSLIFKFTENVVALANFPEESKLFCGNVDTIKTLFFKYPLKYI